MDNTILLDQIDFAQARIEEIEKQVINTNPEQKGYKELVDSYNKWIDRYDNLMEKLETGDVDIEYEKLKLEQAKLDFEKEKFRSQHELECAKRDIQEELETDKLNLERDKFSAEQMIRLKESRRAAVRGPVDVSLKLLETGAKVAVPLIGLAGTMAVASLAYTNDSELKLCNGRIFASAKELLKISTTKL